MEKWEGKVAIVTGTTSGIGRAIAIKLVEAGVHVVGMARREDRGKQLAQDLSGKKGKYHHLTADVSKEQDVLKSYKWIKENLGPIHILINNAGLSRETTLYDGDTQMWKDIFDTNVMGICTMTREAVRVMRANDIAGHIVHINSQGGHMALPLKESNVYSASKFAVQALAETLRQELISLGSPIKISCISPGVVDTEIVKYNQHLKEIVASMVKPLQSEDVADVVLYILSTPPHVQIQDVLVKSITQAF